MKHWPFPRCPCTQDTLVYIRWQLTKAAQNVKMSDVSADKCVCIWAWGKRSRNVLHKHLPWLISSLSVQSNCISCPSAAHFQTSMTNAFDSSIETWLCLCSWPLYCDSLTSKIDVQGHKHQTSRHTYTIWTWSRWMQYAPWFVVTLLVIHAKETKTLWQTHTQKVEPLLLRFGCNPLSAPHWFPSGCWAAGLMMVDQLPCTLGIKAAG